MDGRRYRDLLPAPAPTPTSKPTPTIEPQSLPSLPPHPHPPPSPSPPFQVLFPHSHSHSHSPLPQESRSSSSVSPPAASSTSPLEGSSSITTAVVKNRRQLTRVACESCRHKKAKCNGRRPICSRCATLGLECYFDADPDVSRATSLRRNNSMLHSRLNQLERVIDGLASRPRSEAVTILDRLRSMRADAVRSAGGPQKFADGCFDGDSDAQDYFGLLGSHLQTFASDYRLLATPQTRVGSLEVVAAVAELNTRLSRMDAPSRAAFLDYLRAETSHIPSNHHSSQSSAPFPLHSSTFNWPRPLFRLPARPWTTVTDDDQLVSHLVSLFLTWDHNYMSLLDRDRFVEAMARGELDTPYCSPMLVNAILAYSCIAYHFIENAEALGNRFFSVAKELWDAEYGRASLVNIQGLQVFFLRYGSNGQDKMSFLVLEQIFSMAKELGLFSTELQVPVAQHRTHSIAAWGIFHTTTITHVAFLRHPPLTGINTPRPYNSYELGVAESWIAFPLGTREVSAYYRHHFNETSNLAILSVEMLDLIHSVEPLNNPIKAFEKAQEIYERLQQWKYQLPACLAVNAGAAAHIMILHMQYRSVLMALFGPFREVEDAEFTPYAQIAKNLYFHYAGELGEVLGLYQQAYGSFGPIGLLYYHHWHASALLDNLREDPSRRDELAPSFHTTIQNFACIPGRVARGVLRVTIERAKTMSAGLLLPETEQLMRDFENKVWREEDFHETSSVWPEFSSATRELLRNRGVKPFHLTAMLQRLLLPTNKK